MFKTLIKAMKNPIEKNLHLVNDLSPNFKNLVLSSKVSETAIDEFVKNVVTSGDVKTHLNKLFPGKLIEENMFKLLEKDLAKTNAIFAARKYFEHNLMKELEIGAPLLNDPEKLASIMKENKKLRGVVEKFIDIVKKNKLKFSFLPLTLVGAAAYLIDASKNLSGCYKYEIGQIHQEGQYLLCKVKTCDEKFNSVSINGKFCSEEKCIATKCDENINCYKDTNANDLITFHCFEATWLDVIGLVLKRAKENFTYYLTTAIKLLAILAAISLTYFFLFNLQTWYRVLLSASSGFLAYELLF